MPGASHTSRRSIEKAIELLKSEDGAKVPDLADELEVSRSEARDILNQIDEDYELGSSSDFRYRILRELEPNWRDDL